MYEVEVKVPADHDAVRHELERLGAEHRGRVEQADTYYDAPHRNFAETDEALRVRRVTPIGAEAGGQGDTESRITYKGPMIETESKTRAEIETGVDDGDDAGSIFEALGFTPVATVVKDRDRYALDGYTVVLDDVTDLGEYVEVETETPEEPDAVESAREGAFALLRDLGLGPEDQIRTSYLGLLLDG